MRVFGHGTRVKGLEHSTTMEVQSSEAHRVFGQGTRVKGIHHSPTMEMQSSGLEEHCSRVRGFDHSPTMELQTSEAYRVFGHGTRVKALDHSPKMEMQSPGAQRVGHGLTESEGPWSLTYDGGAQFRCRTSGCHEGRPSYVLLKTQVCQNTAQTDQSS